MSKDEKRLLALFGRFGAQERETLLAFAEFLASRCPSISELSEPEPIPRPEQESVVSAIKRLSASYHMVDKSRMIHETSGLMSQHLMQGRPAHEVIDELELVFRRHYEKLKSESNA